MLGLVGTDSFACANYERLAATRRLAPSNQFEFRMDGLMGYQSRPSRKVSSKHMDPSSCAQLRDPSTTTCDPCCRFPRVEGAWQRRRRRLQERDHICPICCRTQAPRMTWLGSSELVAARTSELSFRVLRRDFKIPISQTARQHIRLNKSNYPVLGGLYSFTCSILYQRILVTGASYTTHHGKIRDSCTSRVFDASTLSVHASLKADAI